MDNAGVYTLAALPIGSAMPASLLTPIAGLDGMTAVSLDVDFKVGGAGSTVNVIVVTSFDGGTNWRHIARFDFTTSSAVKQCNLEGLLSKAIAAYSDLASEGVNDGVLGNMLAAIVTTTGAYSTGTTLSVRASVR
jgi:hypothetical protein